MMQQNHIQELSEEEVIDFEKRFYGIDTSIKKPRLISESGQTKEFNLDYGNTGAIGAIVCTPPTNGSSSLAPFN
jgi:hypothetical protein